MTAFPRRSGTALTSQCACLCVLLLAACHSIEPMLAAPAPRDSTGNARTACQKADALWNERILTSRYAQLPPLTSVGMFDVLQLASTHFSLKALTTEGDELEAGRRKRVHAFGAEARLRWVIPQGSAGSYSGLFTSGTECAIGRFSMADRPTAGHSIPALALKIFIDGKHPSANLHLMHSVDGQTEDNVFAQDFSNILPPARSFATRLLDRLFAGVAERFGARDPNPGRLTLDHLASRSASGSAVAVPVTPYRLLLKPTAQARALFQQARPGDDFRQRLAELPVGLALYDVYALATAETPAELATPLGRLQLASPIVSSRFGDERLYFQHHMLR